VCKQEILTTHTHTHTHAHTQTINQTIIQRTYTSETHYFQSLPSLDCITRLMSYSYAISRAKPPLPHTHTHTHTHTQVVEVEFKADLCHKINTLAHMCVDDVVFYSKTILELMTSSGRYVPDRVFDEIVLAISRSEVLQYRIVRRLFDSEWHIHTHTRTHTGT